MEESSDELFAGVVAPLRVEHLVKKVMSHFASYQKRLRCSSSTFNTPDAGPLMSNSSSNLRGVEAAERVASRHPHGDVASPATKQGESTLTSIVLKPRSTPYWEERELYVAAEDLCCYLNGGVNYRMMCAQYLQTLGVVLNMIKEELRFSTEVDVVPAGTLAELRQRMHSLVNDSVQLLKQYNVAIPASLAHELGQTQPVAPKAVRGKERASETSGGKSGPPLRPPSVGRSVSPAVRHARGQGGPDAASVALPQRPTAAARDETKDASCSRFHALSVDDLPGHPPTPTCEGRDEVRRKSSRTPRGLRELYATEYAGEGMRLVLDALHLVFAHEYDQGDVSDPRRRYMHFKQTVSRELDTALRSYGSFNAAGTERVALSGLYLGQCLAYHVKPCAVLLEVLKKTFSDRDVETLTLTGEKLRGGGVLSLLPLLPRLYRLRELDLGHVEMNDEDVPGLCTALRHHPALRRVNMSMNHLTDACVPELLSAAATMPRLTEVSVYGTAVSAQMASKLAEQLAAQQRAHNAAATPSARRRSSSTTRSSTLSARRQHGSSTTSHGSKGGKQASA